MKTILIGKGALAAVNACTPIYNLLVGFFIGMSTGASVIFSRCLGGADYQKLRESIHTTVLFALLFGLFRIPNVPARKAFRNVSERMIKELTPRCGSHRQTP